jgi:hypothetical protein
MKRSALDDTLFNSDEYARILRGPSERDLVYSGLEETMINAMREMVRGATHARSAGALASDPGGRGRHATQLVVSEELGCSLRSAAFVCSIRKIYAVYKDAGLILA